MIDTLATAALCGVPVERIVEGDEVEAALWVEVTRRAASLRVQIMKAEASHVGAAVAKVFGGGRGRAKS